VSVEPIQWDGTGAVVERGPTHVVLDADPPGPRSAVRGARERRRDTSRRRAGALRGRGAFDELVDGAAVSLWGTCVGVARGRGVAWDPIDVLANGERVVGLSLFAARDDGFGAKIVCPDRRFDLGETVSLALAPSDDPIRLGVG